MDKRGLRPVPGKPGLYTNGRGGLIIAAREWLKARGFEVTAASIQAVHDEAESFCWHKRLGFVSIRRDP